MSETTLYRIYQPRKKEANKLLTVGEEYEIEKFKLDNDGILYYQIMVIDIISYTKFPLHIESTEFTSIEEMRIQTIKNIIDG